MPFGQAERVHLAFLFAVHQVVVVLHRHERRPAAHPLRVEHARELPGEHARGADVARLARLDDVVQRLERFLDRRVRIEPVNLIEVDVVGLEPPSASRRSPA